MVSFPQPADYEARSESENSRCYCGNGHEAKKVPEAQDEIPAIDLGCEARPGKWRGANESDEESAIGCEILDRRSTQLVELRQHAASKPVPVTGYA